MAIHYDRSRVSVVVFCDCGWSDVQLSMDRARGAALDHEECAHPSVTQVRDAARIRAARARRAAAGARGA